MRSGLNAGDYQNSEGKDQEKSLWTSHWLTSHGLCVTLTLAHPVGSTGCRSKVMSLGWCPNSSIGSLAWSQEMVSSAMYPLWLRLLAGGIMSLTPGFYLPLKWPPFQSAFSEDTTAPHPWDPCHESEPTTDTAQRPRVELNKPGGGKCQCNDA